MEIPCQLERWGGKGGSMKVTLTLSSVYAAIIAQMPEEGMVFLRPKELQPALFPRPEGTEQPPADGGGDSEALAGQQKLPITEHHYEFNAEPAQCEFCLNQFGIHELRRSKDPEKPKWWFCGVCGEEHDLILVVPPGADYLENDHPTRCEHCRRQFEPLDLRRWADPNVAYPGWICTECSATKPIVTPWSYRAAVEGGEGVHPAVQIDFDPDEVEVNTITRVCHGGCDTCYGPGFLRAFKKPGSEQRHGPWCRSCAQKAGWTGTPWENREGRTLTWDEYRVRVLGESIDEPQPQPVEALTVHQPGSSEHRASVRARLALGMEVPAEHLEPYAASQWASDALLQLHLRGEVAEAIAESADAIDDAPTTAGAETESGAEDESAPVEIRLRDFEPGNREHRALVRSVLQQGGEVPLDHLEPYRSTRWAQKALMARPEAEELFGCVFCGELKRRGEQEEYLHDEGESRFVCRSCLEKAAGGLPGSPGPDLPKDQPAVMKLCPGCQRELPEFLFRLFEGSEYRCIGCCEERSSEAAR